MLYRTDDFPFHLIPAPLLCWYRENKRTLPWREDPTPYRVWVSEIMLQQTRVEAAWEYYLRFMKELPDVYSLAACEEEKLLKLWEGLGYYSRVRNMQKAARIVTEEYGGEFPIDEKKLLALPGIGDYTAGAVLSIAFKKRAPAVDGNVLRVLSRITKNGTDISEPMYKIYLKEKLKEVYPDEGEACSEFTQSLMELGALVCKPQSAECGVCPMREAGVCLSVRDGTQGEYPVLPPKKEKRKEKVYVFVIETPDGIAINRRTDGVLKGMNEFPSHVVKGMETPEEILDKWGVNAYLVVRNKKYKHIFTHIVWDMTCFYVEAATVPFPTYTEAEIDGEISLPTAFGQCKEIVHLLG